MKAKNSTLKEKKLLKRLTHQLLLHFIWIRDEIEKKVNSKEIILLGLEREEIIRLYYPYSS